jgi:hypothetical protein
VAACGSGVGPHHRANSDSTGARCSHHRGCYLNRWCDPNAVRHGVKVFAWQAIGNGEEIPIDYLNAFDGWWFALRPRFRKRS